MLGPPVPGGDGPGRVPAAVSRSVLGRVQGAGCRAACPGVRRSEEIGGEESAPHPS